MYKQIFGTKSTRLASKKNLIRFLSLFSIAVLIATVIIIAADDNGHINYAENYIDVNGIYEPYGVYSQGYEEYFGDAQPMHTYDYMGEYAQTYGIVPFGGVHTITFNANGGTTETGHDSRDTQDCGSIRYPANMPIIPSWPGGGRAFIGWNFASDYSGAMFTHQTVVTQDTTVYAVWGYLVHFSGNGAQLHQYPANPASINYPNAGFPDRGTCYSTRIIPVSDINWSFNDTSWVVFPDTPQRPGWEFMGWFNTVAIEGGTQFTATTPIIGEVVLSARWEIKRWIVTFDPQGGFLTDLFGWNTLNRRYRWALDTLSVQQSGTSIAIGSGGNAPLPLEYRQNYFRIHNPTAPRWSLEYTPYTTGSGTTMINPPPTAGDMLSTVWPLSAPSVIWDDTWVPPTVPGHPVHVATERRVLSGWWNAPGGWESNNVPLPPMPPGGTVVSTRPIPQTPPNPRWAQPGAGNTHDTWGVVYPAGLAATPVTDDITVYAHYVYRITFDPNGGTAGDQGFNTLVPHHIPGESATLNFRDVIPGGARTLNSDGHRITGNFYVYIQGDGGPPMPVPYVLGGYAVPAGMPSHSIAPNGDDVGISRFGHRFSGWWCTNISAHIDANHPATLGATQFTGDSIINCPCPGTSTAECPHFPWKGGSRTVWAFWQVIPGSATSVVFNLNAPETGEGPGQAFWPTGRPTSLDGQVTDRFFLSRAHIAALDINATDYTETVYNNTNVARLLGVGTTGIGPLNQANVHYDQRFYMEISRTYVTGRSIAEEESVLERMPRNPMRDGYVFMGWYLNPESTGARFSPHENLDAGTTTVYARWVPAIDIVFDYNAGTGQEVVRTVAIGYAFTSLSGQPNTGMNAAGRWPIVMNQANCTGQVHVANQFSASHITQAVTRVGFRHITDNAFNFYQAPTPQASLIFNNIVFNPALLSQYGRTTPATGRQYVRVYKQWGVVLTFHNNLEMIGSGLFTGNRVAHVAEGQSINQSLSTATRHPNLAMRMHVFPPASGWLGTTGANGTMGGWPAYTPNNPVGGHWPELFQLAGPAWNLVEWNTQSDGTGTEVTGDTPITESTVIYAIWGQYLVFHPGWAGDEAQNMPTPLRRPVDIGLAAPLPDFPATPPYWPGRVFRGWHAWGDTTNPALTALTNIVIARTYHAMWYAYVVWHPAYPSNTGAFIPGYAANQPTAPRPVDIGTPFGAVGPPNPVRAGGWILGRDANNAVNWFAVDTSMPNNRRMYTRYAPPIMIGTHLYPEWRGTVIFRPNGGLFYGSTNTQSRSVPEGLSLSTNPASLRAPTSVTHASADFLGWRELDASGNPLPNANLLTTEQVEAVAVTNPFHWFEAVWDEGYWPQLQLPLTGGGPLTIFAAIGSVAIAAGLILLTLAYHMRKSRSGAFR